MKGIWLYKTSLILSDASKHGKLHVKTTGLCFWIPLSPSQESHPVKLCWAVHSVPVKDFSFPSICLSCSLVRIQSIWLVCSSNWLMMRALVGFLEVSIVEEHFICITELWELCSLLISRTRAIASMYTMESIRLLIKLYKVTSYKDKVVVIHQWSNLSKGIVKLDAFVHLSVPSEEHRKRWMLTYFPWFI